MSDCPKELWQKIREYLLLLSSCRTRQDLLHTASVEVRSLIPFDAAAGVFSTADARFLSGTGMSDSVNASYNAYYRTRQPLSLDNRGRIRNLEFLISARIVDWRKFDSLEFVSDFMMPNGMCKSLSHFIPGHSITMTIHSSRSSPDFMESDVNTLGIVNEYLNDLAASLDRGTSTPAPNLSAEEIAERFRSLSRREAEVCSLVVRRLNTSEIAMCLFVSPRTIEKHMESIFLKLEVRSRDQLRWRLGARPPMYAPADPAVVVVVESSGRKILHEAPGSVDDRA